MVTFLRNLRVAKLRKQQLDQELAALVEQHWSRQWWQTVTDMQVLRDEVAELTEDMLEAQFGEDWTAYADLQGKRSLVAAQMHLLFPAYELAAVELAKRHIAIPRWA